MPDTTIRYNGINPVLGLGPTPFVTRSEDFIQVGERLVAQETLVLHGALTGHCEFNAGHTNSPYSQFTSLVSGGDYPSPQLQLFKNFAKDFQTFEIYDDSTKVFSRDLVQVTNITFPENNYGAIHPYLPYEITLQAYPVITGGRTFDDGTPWNVLQPTHELSYQTQEDATISISENISAQGLNTSASGSNALDNAVKWVKAYDCATHGLPMFNGEPTTACLKTVAETINRFAGSYEKRNTYIFDPIFPGTAGVLRYTVTYSYSEEEGISTVEVNGSIEGCRNGQVINAAALNDLRSRYNQFQPYNIAISTKIQLTGNPALNPNPISKSVTEDSLQLKIAFSFTFNDDMRSDPSFDARCTFNYDYENDVVTATIDGDCTTRYYNQGHAPEDFPLPPNSDGTDPKWKRLSEFADNISLFSKIQSAYSTYLASIGLLYSDYPLNTLYTSLSRVNNYLDWKITLNASYRSQPAILPPAFRKADVTINYTPALNQYKEFPCLDGKGYYNVFDLRFATRANCSIQFNGTLLPGGDVDQGIAAAQAAVMSLQANNFTGNRLVMEGQQYSKTTASNKVNVSASANYSAEQAAFTV